MLTGADADDTGAEVCGTEAEVCGEPPPRTARCGSHRQSDAHSEHRHCLPGVTCATGGVLVLGATWLGSSPKIDHFPSLMLTKGLEPVHKGRWSGAAAATPAHSSLPTNGRLAKTVQRPAHQELLFPGAAKRAPVPARGRVPRRLERLRGPSVQPSGCDQTPRARGQAATDCSIRACAWRLVTWGGAASQGGRSRHGCRPEPIRRGAGALGHTRELRLK